MKKRKLNVYLLGKKAGILTEYNTNMRFDYEPTAENKISIRMPLLKKTYTDKFARPFFENLIPEADIKKAITKKLGISNNNPISLLFEIGGDCAGAISLYPIDYKPKIQNEKLKEITKNEFVEILNNLPKSPLLSGNDVRLSLAGAQPKLAIIYKNGKMFFPNDSFFSTHIIKKENNEYKGIIENEYFCMRLANELGLEIPNVEIKKIKGTKSLFIKRYDREDDVRIHQEDFCQCLGFVSSKKYQKDGGPSIKNCFNFIENHSSMAGKDKKRLIQAVVFNYLIGNNDAHAKNFSMLHQEDGYFVLAPFYDLVSTTVYPELSKFLAMKIGNAKESNQVRKENFIELADDLSIKPNFILKEIERQKKTIAKASDKIKKEMKKQDIFHPILNKISFVD
ncbi:MAG: type II toxin-antitoxin system HipA family toxin [Alphaproteobacteria bacterium]|nr:MAG: hypothetical protein B6I23_00015 [Rickettsiaceae bacterium 4572_127]